MSEKEYYDGGYVTGPAPQILPVGDCAQQFVDFQREMLDKVASTLGISYEQMAADYCAVHRVTPQQVSAYADAVLRQWLRDNATCFRLPLGEDSV